MSQPLKGERSHCRKRPGFEPQGYSASDSSLAGQRDRLDANLDSAAPVLSFQAWLLLKPQFLYLYNGLEWAGGVVSVTIKREHISGSAIPLPFSCLSPSRYEMNVWDGLGFLLVS